MECQPRSRHEDEGCDRPPRWPRDRRQEVSGKNVGMGKLLLILLIGTYVALSAAAQTKGPGFTVTKIGDGVYAALGDDGGPAGSNAGFIVGSSGVAVVDSFTAVAPAKD